MKKLARHEKALAREGKRPVPVICRICGHEGVPVRIGRRYGAEPVSYCANCGKEMKPCD